MSESPPPLLGTVPAHIPSEADPASLHPISAPTPSGGSCGAVAMLDPLSADPLSAALVATAARGLAVLIIRSGPMTEPGEPSLAWLPASRRALDAWCDALEGAEEAAATQLVLWPHMGGAVSDMPSLQSFLRGRPRWKFLFDYTFHSLIRKPNTNKNKRV